MAELRADALAASQERMKRELGAFFQDVSRARPVVVFLDDLHWADVSTIDILNYLAGRFADMRVLVLTTYRPAEMALAQHPFLGITQQPAIARPVRGDRPRRSSTPADVDRYLALEFPEHRLPAGLLRADPRQDRGQPALHGRPRPLPARFGRHRRGERHLGPGAVDGGCCRAICRSRCAA